MFSKKGVLVIEREDLEKDEDTVMSDALECGASDFEADDDVFTIYTETDDFGAVRDELEKLGYTFVSAEIEMVPSTYTKLEDEETATRCRKCLICSRITMISRMYGTTGKWTDKVYF